MKMKEIESRKRKERENKECDPQIAQNVVTILEKRFPSFRLSFSGTRKVVW